MRILPLTATATVQLTSFAQANGSLTSPGVFQQIVGLTIPAGTYTVNWTVTLSGTVGVPEANNFAILIGPTLLAVSVNPGAAGTYPQAPVTFTSPGDGTFASSLNVKSWNNTPTTGATYAATIGAGGGAGIAAAGPSVPGEVWLPQSASISCGGAIPTIGSPSVFLYAGNGISANTFVDSTYNVTSAASSLISGQQLHPGQEVFAAWSGGPPGQLATLVIKGTRQVP